MKVISIVSGAVALKLTWEDVNPQHRIPVPDYVSLIHSRYAFQARADASPGISHTFQSGRFEGPDGQLRTFTQLQITRTGLVFASQSTDDACAIAEDYCNFINNEFGYRIDYASAEKIYIGDVIIEFDGDRPNVLSSIFFIEKIINARLKGQRNLKNLTFGVKQDEVLADPETQLPLIYQIEQGDFIIERRVNSEASANRFYSRSPQQTKEHIALLEEIERAVSEF